MKRSVRAGLLATAALAAAAVLVPATGALSAGSLTAAFTLVSDWGTGYEAKYSVTNGTSTTITSWRVEFDLPAGGSISSSWDAAHPERPALHLHGHLEQHDQPRRYGQLRLDRRRPEAPDQLHGQRRSVRRRRPHRHSDQHSDR